MRRHDNEMNLQPDKAPEARNTTWAGEHGEHLRSFQSPEELFLLTLPFIERAYRTCKVLVRQMSGYPTYQGLTRVQMWRDWNNGLRDRLRR